jgi:hypothetical protein
MEIYTSEPLVEENNIFQDKFNPPNMKSYTTLHIDQFGA